MTESAGPAKIENDTSQNPLRRWELVGVLATLAIVLAVPLRLAVVAAHGPHRPARTVALYVGSEACKSCHQVGETAKNATAPELNGLFGRAAGSVPGFNYSPAMKAAGFTWDDASFAAFLQDPKGKVAGTKMMAGQTKDPAQIANLAAYLKTFDASGKKQP